VRRPGQHRRWFQLLAGAVKPFLYAFTTREWRGIENIPPQGGVIVVANHVTVVDPFTLAHAIYDGARRIPRFLAKAEIFNVPVVGPLLRKGGQIAVYRRSREAANSLRDAERAVAAGELVIFPEGTCTRDPDGWPMASKTGVARLALACDVPVVPVAHWGAHRILGYHSKRPHLFPPKRVYALAGPPVDLTKYRTVEPTNEVLREVTDLLMTRVKDLLGEIRGETPPPGFFVATGSTPSVAAQPPAEGSTTPETGAA
jgi:1-acyl-sn-glycerol-3-phosphate acyltransferase